MTTDTAKAILDGDWTIICEAIDTPGKVADLQAMAKLWLMKTKCTSALHFIIDTTPDGTTVKDNAIKWLAEIEALEEK